MCALKQSHNYSNNLEIDLLDQPNPGISSRKGRKTKEVASLKVLAITRCTTFLPTVLENLSNSTCGLTHFEVNGSKTRDESMHWHEPLMQARPLSPLHSPGEQDCRWFLMQTLVDVSPYLSRHWHDPNMHREFATHSGFPAPHCAPESPTHRKLASSYRWLMGFLHMHFPSMHSKKSASLQLLPLVSHSSPNFMGKVSLPISIDDCLFVWKGPTPVTLAFSFVPLLNHVLNIHNPELTLKASKIKKRIIIGLEKLFWKCILMLSKARLWARWTQTWMNERK